LCALLLYLARHARLHSVPERSHGLLGEARLERQHVERIVDERATVHRILRSQVLQQVLLHARRE
jgi:hypothetical protein